MSRQSGVLALYPKALTARVDQPPLESAAEEQHDENNQQHRANA